MQDNDSQFNTVATTEKDMVQDLDNLLSLNQN